MTDAELVLVEEIVARLRDGLPIHDIAPALDPSLVELATALAGEMSEVGWVAGQAVPGGFDAVWQSVAVLGGVGASGAAAASIGGTAAAGGGGASTGAVAGGGIAGGGASAGGFGGAITGIIGGVGGTTAAIAGTAVVASAVIAAVLLTTPDEPPPADDPPVVASPDLPGDELEPQDLPPPGPADTDVEDSEPVEPPTDEEIVDEETVEDEPAEPSGDGGSTTDTSGTTDGAPATAGQTPDTPQPPPPSPSTPPSDPGPSRPEPPAPDPPTQPDPAPPVARSVTTTVVSREPTPIDVLANDEGPEVPLDPSTLTVVSQPSNGSTSIANGRVTYRSARLWLGADTFTYRICDQAGRCAQANVTVTTTRRVDTSTATLPSPAPQYTFSLGSQRDPDSAEFVELGGGRVDRLGHDSWRWLGPPGRVDYPVMIMAHLANTDGTMVELRMTLNRGR